MKETIYMLILQNQILKAQKKFKSRRVLLSHKAVYSDINKLIL